MCPHVWRGVYMCSTCDTHVTCSQRTHACIICEGNWLYNSCHIFVSDCYCGIFLVCGVYAYALCAHLAYTCACMCVCVYICEGGQGAYGGCTLVCMYNYTDQEYESVNHCTDMVLCIRVGSQYVTIYYNIITLCYRCTIRGWHGGYSV